MAIRRWKGSWQADVCIKGDRHKKSFPTRKEAEEWEHWARDQARQGIYPFERPIRFKDFSKIYSERSTHKTPKTLSTDKSRIKYLNEFFGDKLLSSINPGMIEEFKASLKDKISPTTINHYLKLLRAMFRKAEAWGYLVRSPFRGISFHREPPGRERTLKKEELEKLLTYCNPTLKLAILTGYYSGLRKGEILNLLWEDVDLKNGFITIRSTKTGEARTVPLHPTLVKEFGNFPRKSGSEYIIPNPKTGERMIDFKVGWSLALKKAGIKNFRFHDLRHTFASNLAMSGADPLTIKKFTGHKTLAMVARYAHLSDGHLREAISRLGNKESGISTSPLRPPKGFKGEGTKGFTDVAGA